MSLKILDFLEKPWPNLAKKAQNINLKVKKPFWYIKVSFNNEETYQTMHLAKFGQENVAKTPNFQFQRYFYRHESLKNIFCVLYENIQGIWKARLT